MGALFSKSNGRGHARFSKAEMITLVREEVTKYAEEQKTSWSTTIGGWSFVGLVDIRPQLMTTERKQRHCTEVHELLDALETSNTTDLIAYNAFLSTLDAIIKAELMAEKLLIDSSQLIRLLLWIERRAFDQLIECADTATIMATYTRTHKRLSSDAANKNGQRLQGSHYRIEFDKSPNLLLNVLARYCYTSSSTQAAHAFIAICDEHHYGTLKNTFLADVLTSNRTLYDDLTQNHAVCNRVELQNFSQ